ncbi:hypothetical protein [Halobaculum limi]|uniref:hypothetical protein n=1 Tax=Halobaculum limi TaxID=3031916 RepID=UPI0024056038|nr:hypothetical protein [Halobaculum sp. YSMS11]
MSRRLDWLAAMLLSLAALPAVAVAHPGHATPTPAGPFAGVSPVGAAVVVAGFLVGTTGLLLVREDVVSERTASAALVVGAGLLLAGGALALLSG